MKTKNFNGFTPQDLEEATKIKTDFEDIRTIQYSLSRFILKENLNTNELDVLNRTMGILEKIKSDKIEIFRRRFID